MELPLGGPRVAVVGTRRPSPAGVDAARLIAGRLAERGAAVVSGLARGTDTAAHRAAIRRGGSTIAVLGTPLDGFYPPENRDLQLRIMREHLAISQFPPGHTTGPRDFLARDRVIALIADAVVIVEAGPAGGSVFTGWAALRLGRPVRIWRDTFDNSNLAWPREMARYGARRLDEGSVGTLAARRCSALAQFDEKNNEFALSGGGDHGGRRGGAAGRGRGRDHYRVLRAGRERTRERARGGLARCYRARW